MKNEQLKSKCYSLDRDASDVDLADIPTHAGVVNVLATQNEDLVRFCEVAGIRSSQSLPFFSRRVFQLVSMQRRISYEALRRRCARFSLRHIKLPATRLIIIIPLSADEEKAVSSDDGGRIG